MRSNKPNKTEFNGNKLKEKLMIKQKETEDFKLVHVIGITLVLLVLFFLYPRIARSTNDVDYESVKENNDIKISFTGDVSPSRHILDTFSNEFQPEDLYTDVKNIWEDSDLTLINLEAVALKGNVSEYTEGSGNIFLHTDEENITAIKNSGIDLVALANNHSADYGRVGMVDTMSLLDESDLEYIGLGMNKDESQEAYIEDFGNKRIGIQNLTDVIPGSISSSTSLPGAATTNHLNYLSVLEDNFNRADYNIVVIHWGSEYTINPDKDVMELGRELIDLGADLVIGSHPHVLHPVEKYNDGIIAYSMGNTIFDQVVSRTDQSAIGSLYLKGDNTQLLEFVPIQIREGRPEKTDNKKRVNEIFGTLTKHLNDDEYYIENNKLYINLD